MQPIKDIKEFNSLVKYAFAIRFGSARLAKEVPTVGIVFGNQEIPVRCHEYICNSFDGNKMKINIIADHITAKVELLKVEEADSIFCAELNYDHNELMEFKDDTPSDSRVVLIFGFKHGCDYLVTGKKSDKSKDFSPIVLSGYAIKLTPP